MRSLLLVFFLFLVVRVSAIELTIKVDSLGVVNCCINGIFRGRLVVEQFRWNRWVVMHSFGSNRIWKDSCAQTTMMLHSGENQFRLTAISVNCYVEIIHSSVVKTVDPSDHYTCGFERVFEPTDQIKLKRKSYWEIHDQDGYYVKAGTSVDVPLGTLPKGQYFLYYDNCITEFLRE